MGAEIFVEIPRGEHEKEAFTGRGGRLALRAKQQRGPQRLELLGLVRWGRCTAPTHPWLWSWTGRKRWLWHRLILAKEPGWVKIGNTDWANRECCYVKRHEYEEQDPSILSFRLPLLPMSHLHDA
jgi:hypothetical protein